VALADPARPSQRVAPDGAAACWIELAVDGMSQLARFLFG
jgi:hypothetical protein